MVRVSVLGDTLKSILKRWRRGKRQVLVRPSSKVVIKFLQVMQKHGYIEEFEVIDDHRSGKIVVSLNGRLNKCASFHQDLISKLTNWKLDLPIASSRQFGFIILTTSYELWTWGGKT